MAKEIGAQRVLVPTTKAVEALQRVEFRDYPRAVLQGSTVHFNVYYDPPLGAAGQRIANGVLRVCEPDYRFLSRIFSGITPAGLPVNIILARLPQGGAYHYGCAATAIYSDVRTAPSVAPVFSSFLALAELVEVFEANQGRGWNCGASNGEGLSRVLATARYPRQIAGFATAATWLNQGRPDFVNRTDPTDGNPLSTGCAVLFLNYLRYQLNYRWRDIVAAAGQTLSVTYMRLTGDASNPFPPFKALLAANFPPGQQAVLNTDNPFPIRAARPQRRRRPGRGPEQGRRAEASLQDHEADGESSGEESEIAVMVPATPVEGEASTRLPGAAPTDAEETAEPDAEAVGDDAAPKTSARTSGRFVGNKNSFIFHPVTSANLPSEENRVYFESEDEAIEAGFRRAEREGTARSKS